MKKHDQMTREELLKEIKTLRSGTLNWQTTFDAVNDAIMILDMEQRILRCNKASRSLFRQWPGEIVGRQCGEVIHGTMQPTGGCPVTRMLRSRRRESTELAMGDRWYLITVDPLLDEGGELCGAVHIVSDITERKRTEEALHREMVLSDTIIDCLPGSFYLLDCQGKLMRWNHTYEEVTGLPAEKLLRMNVLSSIFEEDRALVAGKMAEVFEKGQAEAEVRVLAKDGIRNYLVTGRRMDIGGEPHLLGTGIDITERKRADKALRDQFDQVSTIFDEMNTIVLIDELETYRVLYLNKYGVSLLGNDWEGKRCNEVTRCGQPLPCPFASPERLRSKDALQGHDTHEYQNAVTRRWYQCVDKVIPWTDGTLVRMSVAADVTDYKDLERAKDEMISAVSHEMRTPLTAMLGYTNYLQENRVDEEHLQEYLGIIHQETERLCEMVSNFLDLQRMKARKRVFTLNPLAIRPLLDEAASLFSMASAHHRITIAAPVDIPPVMSDEEPLRQVLINLLSNAIKYSPSGGEIILGAGQDDDETLTLWVKDEGIGIAPEALDKVFDTFYQVESGDRRASRGTGLGLAVVREIVNDLGGRVGVKSVVGTGSTFYVSLPIAKE